MVTDLISAMVGIIQLMEKGIRFFKKLDNKAINVTLSTEHVLPSSYGRGVLVFCKIGNESESNVTITGMKLTFKSGDAERIPVTKLVPDGGNNEFIVAHGHMYQYNFDRLDIEDLTIMPDDIFLLPQQSISGFVLFQTRKIKNLLSPRLTLFVGCTDQITKEIK